MAEVMRGMRLGAQSLESDQGVELSSRKSVQFICPSDHNFEVVFSADAELPDTWECKKCDAIGIRQENGKSISLAASDAEAARTHYDMVLERRSRDELEDLLAEVLADMRKRRSEGRLTA